MEKGVVLDIDHFAVHDGPGIRTSIYLKGCPLCCQWCHSPESQKMCPQIMYAQNRCISCGMCVKACNLSAQTVFADGTRLFDRETCTECGKCVVECPSGALFISGKEMSTEDVKREVLPDKIFYDNSGGGVTISGGECLMQAQFTLELLKELKEAGIHTIIETSGYGRQDDLLSLAEYTDTFYYDFKLGDKELFRKYTGGDLKIVLDNLAALRMATEHIVLRVPLIPRITDTLENVCMAYDTAVRMQIGEVHLLPYNQNAGAKYEWCGREYGLGERMQEKELFERLLEAAPAELTVWVVK